MKPPRAKIARSERPTSASTGLLDDRSQGVRHLDHRVFHQPVNNLEYDHASGKTRITGRNLKGVIETDGRPGDSACYGY
jgi:hypothetical protein